LTLERRSFVPAPMTFTWKVEHARKSDLRCLAELLALALQRGDCVALHGDLGTGKTTLARALVCALLNKADAEVPSPTFSLVQTYETARFPVAHFDFYRLTGADEARELAFEEAVANGVVVVEWPERAEELLLADRLDVRLSETSDPAARGVALEGHGRWQDRTARLAAMGSFLQTAGWWGGHIRYLQGDASTRRYARLEHVGRRAVLMDAPRQPDGPPIRDGRPYSRIARLAEDAGPFIAIARALRNAGLSAPEIYAHNLDQGLVLFEDLGDRVFALELESGTPQALLWQAAVDVLVHLLHSGIPTTLLLADGSRHTLPVFDRDVLQVETELLLDWYWPALRGGPVPTAARAEFSDLWKHVFDQLLALPTSWVLRDYHSPNLLWLAERTGIERVGVIDFQDAVQGHPAYDLVSLLQDARLDVPAEIETTLFDHYCRAIAAVQPDFDRATFSFAYAALGAQRNTKILGIFARLACRDGKGQYLRHIPRIWRYLERNLAHVALRPLRQWYDRNFPQNARIPPLG
jgi:tRNA threonylcarbamoyl adenosine modification protein YjeE